MKKLFLTTTLLASLFAAPTLFAGEMININKADAAALDTLDGIGAKKAEAIVAYRTEHGDFKALEDIKEVSGIGDKLFDKIKGSISLTDAANTTDKAEKADTAKDDKTSADKSAAAEKVTDKPASKADKS
jgi:competence protein ComEA